MLRLAALHVWIKESNLHEISKARSAHWLKAAWPRVPPQTQSTLSFIIPFHPAQFLSILQPKYSTERLLAASFLFVSHLLSGALRVMCFELIVYG
jgi:hypothetical protein